MKYSIVDVFAEARSTGNQLAVVEEYGQLSTQQMASIAREFNFSETSFVIERTENRAHVRIFTPSSELPFAGHPTIGTAWLLTRGKRPITLELAGGNIAVHYENDIGWMTPPPATVATEVSAAEAAELIGAKAADIDIEITPVRIRCGPEFVLFAVRDMKVLQAAAMPPPPISGGVDGAVFIVCRGGYTHDADFAARMFFFDGSTMREDPATGSANAAFASHLSTLGRHGEFIVDQGFQANRPSRIYLRVGRDIEVGGKTVLFAEGQLSA